MIFRKILLHGLLNCLLKLKRSFPIKKSDKVIISVLLLLQFSTLTVFADNDSIMYRAFISGQKSQWAVVFNTDNNGFSDIEELEYLYGYIGWLITDKDKDATHYLFMMRDKIGNAHLTPSQKALYNSISLSYGILLGKNNTIISGPQTLKSVKKALTLDSLSYMNNIQMANVLLNMPAVFGGSKEKAAGYYLRARFILEENNQTQIGRASCRERV